MLPVRDARADVGGGSLGFYPIVTAHDGDSENVA